MSIFGHAIAQLALVATVIGGEAVLVGMDAGSARSVVKIDMGDAHCSGVHIGNGYVVTAEHCVSEADRERGSRGRGTHLVSVKVVGTDGSERTGEVLWANVDADIALLHIDNAHAIKAAPLSCAVAPEGTRIKGVGNPIQFDFLTYTGTVAGTPRKAWDWRVALPIDMTITQGMSGGPIYDDAGRVVGIIVGGASLGPFSSNIVLSFAVPSSEVCRLMGGSRG